MAARATFKDGKEKVHQGEPEHQERIILYLSSFSREGIFSKVFLQYIATNVSLAKVVPTVSVARQCQMTTLSCKVS